MATVEEILEHKGKLEELKTKKEAAQGAMSTYMEQLQEKYECDSITDAEDLLSTMRSNLVEDEKKLDKKVADWSEKYADLLTLAES